MSFLFFVIFLDVAYLFGFALAFHDQDCLNATKVTALRMINLPSPDDLASKDRNNPSATPSPRNASATKTDQPLTEDTSYYFYFDSGQARLDKADLGVGCDLGKDQDKEPPYQPPQRVEWTKRQTPDGFNFCSLQRLTNRALKDSKNGMRVRIILVGRSDNDPIKDRYDSRGIQELTRYKSNYELSEARVQNVRFELTQALKDRETDPRTWQNLEWLSLPSSDELPIEADEVLNQIIKKDHTLTHKEQEDFKDQNKRVVKASVASLPGDITSLQMEQLNRDQSKAMKLIDYMYFSIYTITTTGYGDIVPTTAYSKFLISVENICEVIFLVVFFNALVSIKRDKRTDDVVDSFKTRTDTLVNEFGTKTQALAQKIDDLNARLDDDPDYNFDRFR